MTKQQRYDLRVPRRLRADNTLATRNARRVFGASGYLGMAPSPDQATRLNSMGREFRDRQNQSRT